MKMMNAFLKIAFFFALIASPSTLCYGLMRKLYTEDPIALTCRKVTDFGFCAITLRSDPRSAGASVYELAAIAVDHIGTHAKVTTGHLQELIPGCNDKEKEVATTCIQDYDNANNNDVPAAEKSLSAKAYADAKNSALAAMKDGGNCQDTINKNPSSKFQIITSMNGYMHDISQLSSDLIGLLS